MTPEEHLKDCLRELDAKDYYNGMQTVRVRHPLGSETRGRIIAEATFWQGQIDQSKRDGIGGSNG